MTYGGGGWTVIQKRQRGTPAFDKTWYEYVDGFGSVYTDDFWLGLDRIHQLTSQKAYRLVVILEDWTNIVAHAEYSQFAVGNAASKYTLQIGGYAGTTGDSFTTSNAMAFSTKDQDNDKAAVSCADYNGRGGWWYPTSCGQGTLNGHYLTNCKEDPSNPSAYCDKQGLVWASWRGSKYSLKKSTMMIKPALLIGSTISEITTASTATAAGDDQAKANTSVSTEGEITTPTTGTAAAGDQTKVSTQGKMSTAITGTPAAGDQAKGTSPTLMTVLIPVLAVLVLLAVLCVIVHFVRKKRAAKKPATPNHDYDMVDPGSPDNDEYEMVDTRDSRPPARSPQAQATFPSPPGVSGTQSDSNYQALDPRTMGNTDSEYTSLTTDHAYPDYENSHEYLDLSSQTTNRVTNDSDYENDFEYEDTI
uniref:Fibrinogen C-terminal domain-containing protein n=1 Tax=Branchiostoma floridae TaxID=7739 RepID=C3XYQ0_BRAFL|eukprot:XP_002610925.1 hypothetical protein BRAFLDRAFT_91522 [Branchiostoma floridae]